MNINPLTLIENVIIEHGSSVIQGKHLALLKEQIAVLKEERSLSGLQLAKLQSRNEELESENQHLRQQIQNLSVKYDRMHDDAEKILKLFFDTQKDFSAQEMSSHFNLSIGATESHFDALKARRFIAVSRIGATGDFNRPATFKITKEGRAHIL